MRSRRKVAIGCLAVAAAATGCGGLADEDWSPEPLAVIHGTFSRPPSVSVASEPAGHPADLGLALFWYSAYEDGFLQAEPLENPYRHERCEGTDSLRPEVCDGTFATGREVCTWRDELPQPLVLATKYTQKLPFEFEVPIFDLPPGSARYDLSRQGGSGTFALGYVIAFEDGDGDGAFDPGTPVNGPEPTIAISAFQDYLPPEGHPRTSWFVAFLDGTIALENVAGAAYEEVLRGLPQGFSYWRKDEWTDEFGRSMGIRRRAVPIETPIDLYTLPSPDRITGCTEGVRELRRLDAIPAGAAPLRCSVARDVAVWNPEGRGTDRPCEVLRQEYRADFSCASSPPPAWDCPGRGFVRIVVSTASAWEGDADPDGYDFVVSRTSGATLVAGSLGTDDEITFVRVPPGEYVVTLGGLALGCRVMPVAPPATFTVEEGQMTETVYVPVECGGFSTSFAPGLAEGAASRAACLQ